MRLLLVEDDAMIGEALQQSIFDHFFRLGDGLSDTGSGLGLAMFRPIADRHGTALQLTQSERLGGLRVAFSWPLSKQFKPAV